MADLTDFEIEQLRRDVTARDNQIKDLKANLWNAEQAANFAYSVSGHTDTVPKWLSKKPPTSSRHEVAACFMLSDLHFQEVVREQEVNGFNAYNHDISVERFDRVVERAACHPQKYIGDRGIEKAVVCLGGDIITGSIHDEYERTNDMTEMEAVVFWTPKLASAMTYLADEWDCPIVVPQLTGNHDRLHKKKPTKQAAESAYTWIIYSMMNKMLENDDRITPLLTSSSEVITQVYDLKILWEHGDMGVGGSSGSGIGGIWPTMRRKVQNAHAAFQNVGMPFDYYVVGHWHQFAASREFLVNNCLKGYDEFASKFRFAPSAPSQALFYVTPERGLGDWHEIFAD